MDNTILTAIISAVASVLGAFFGVISSQKTVNYRLNRIENEIKELNKLTDEFYYWRDRFDNKLSNLKERVSKLENKE